MRLPISDLLAKAIKVQKMTNASTKKLLCETGKERAGCKRKERNKLKKGIIIQTWKCHGEKNQEFKFANG